MKNLILFCALVLSATTSFAYEIKSSDKEAETNIARVVQLFNLVNKPQLVANIVVRDSGGSTDLSPTQQAFFTLYVKGEMFSTDAAFDLGPVFAVKSAKRIDGGIYETVVERYDYDANKFHDVTLRIDAVKAIRAIQAVDCGGDFDCPASNNFETSISVTEK
ncbi:hypothetical protein [Bdellovibrio sp. NC01]|uniref:hypothetical protein n=1 Tax=Bdellovibrio sp. NC01 TaxID=2220073 RepID=UPI00115AEB57|nr:hypothetical protein [Bdellovibrio sp. NC01]QDK38365.1 hypothetical protein DOE51_12635 [Bdellovibrio sp. NC01]